MKKVIKAVLPPIAVWSARALIRKVGAPDLSGNGDRLFNGDDALFKQVLRSATLYGEYGCGASTRWVLRNASARLRAVDTSQVWINAAMQGLDDTQLDRAELHHIDLGPLRNWGRPVSYEFRDNFAEYTDWIWETDHRPDTVLIDGRFRVACFLTTLKHARPGTRILFDDYINRPHYHIVETYLERAEVCGRQALFIAPERGTLDAAALDREIANFRYVMD